MIISSCIRVAEIIKGILRLCLPYLLAVLILAMERRIKIFFWLHHAVCRILVLSPEIQPTPPAVEVLSLNHLTSREVPRIWLMGIPRGSLKWGEVTFLGEEVIF